MTQILLKDRLKEAIRQRGLNASELAKQADVKPSFVYDILNGKSSNPSTSKMARISGALEVALPSLLGIEEITTPYEGEFSEYAVISSMLATSFGNAGSMIVEEKKGEPYYFRRSWVADRLKTEPENLRMIFVEGDSMEPTLCQTDMVLVDITKQTPSPSGIFVLFDGMGLVAKRLEYLAQSKPPSVRILSDNPQYHSYECTIDETEIIGRVVWFAREI